MNGAELPCGTILQVEPATTTTRTTNSDATTTTTLPTLHGPKGIVVLTDENDDDDDVTINTATATLFTNEILVPGPTTSITAALNVNVNDPSSQKIADSSDTIHTKNDETEDDDLDEFFESL